MKGLEISQEPFLLQSYYEKMIILYYRMMQCIASSDEVAEICQTVLVKTDRCEELKYVKQRDSIRELIIFAYRRGFTELLINHCESLYPQLELNNYQLADAFQKSLERTQQYQLSQLLVERENFQERLVDILAQLSNDDLRHLAFLLGSDVGMYGYSRYIYGSVDLGNPTEEEPQKNYGQPTEQEMRKTLTDSNIPNDHMDLAQLQYELKCLFVRSLVAVFADVDRINNILTAYLQL